LYRPKPATAASFQNLLNDSELKWFNKWVVEALLRSRHAVGLIQPKVTEQDLLHLENSPGSQLIQCVDDIFAASSYDIRTHRRHEILSYY
jgi:hypothetical protein